jgi:hypothetical protein
VILPSDGDAAQGTLHASGVQQNLRMQ